MRLIDADSLEKKLHELALDEWNQKASTSWSNALLECEDIVYNAPTVDAVKVVRCKDCKHRDPEDHKCDCGALERAGNIFPVADDYFCSWGERKEDEID